MAVLSLNAMVTWLVCVCVTACMLGMGEEHLKWFHNYISIS